MRILVEFENESLSFQNPRYVISCYNPHEIKKTFYKIEQALDRGLFVAGFFSYEAGYGFEKTFSNNECTTFPLIYAGCYVRPADKQLSYGDSSAPPRVTKLRLNITRSEYNKNICTIRNCIAAGDVYQITYCIKMCFDFKGDAFSLYRDLLAAQPVPYAAYIETPDYKILSLSPEMFLKKRGGSIVTKPTKGSWPRGTDCLSDAAARRQFQKDKKNRAENLMITDLLRNDLGRIGSGIHVPKLFEITPYNTLFQMTSTVAGVVDPKIKIYDLFRALFPSGSVTGAPKIRSMELIRELEREKRHIYTGAVGYINPNRDMLFNIPIRTILLQNGQGEMGIGGGIVWDSTPEGEWAEGLLKAKFFSDLAENESKAFIL
jgi:para-aminobenzoate synthetase / 4-amino-4-deoxychorismate lyase